MKIVNLESSGYSPAAAEKLSSAGELCLLDLSTRSQVLKAVKDADVVITRLRFRLDEMILSSAEKLKVVATPTTGTDHVDTEYLEKRGIHFISLKGERKFLDSVFATAEHTVGMILSLIRNTHGAHRNVSGGKLWDRDSFRGYELFGKRAGILGLGRLGTRVAHYLNSFGMEVVASDIAPVSNPDSVTMVDLETLLETSDILTVHIDLREENRGFMNSEKFRRMKKGSFFINTSRGDVVDESALLKSLENGRIRGAALDVLQGEVNKTVTSSPIIEACEKHNILLTPHIGGATFESMEKTEIFIADKIREFLCSEKLIH